MSKPLLKSVWTIYTALVLGVLGPVNSRVVATEGESLANVLRGQNRWKKIQDLQSWSRPLSKNDISMLEGFVEETKHDDWMLNYSARFLLRRNVPDRYAVSPKVEKAEELFAKMGTGKVPDGAYNKYIEEIVAVGNDVVVLLLDLLEYRGQEDYHRKDIAIKVLGELDDDRVVPMLRNEIAKEKHRNHLEQELLAILKHDSSDEIADYVARVIAGQESDFDQGYVISFLSLSELSNRAQMRLYAHYEEFRGYGKGNVIRGLGRIGDKAAFDELVDILQKENYGDAFRFAAYELRGLKNYNASAVFLEMLKKAPDHACSSLIQPLAERCYLEAIPVLEQRIMRAGNDADGMRCRIWAAAALCRLGKDYEKNAAIVRGYLRKDDDPNTPDGTPYSAAGWLHDDETIDILISKIASEKPNKGVLKWAINALGQIGDKKGLPVLGEALTRVSLDTFVDVGNAIAAIGRKNEDQELVADGEKVQTVARYLKNLGGQQQGSEAASLEAKQRRHEHEQVIVWLRQHAEVIPNIVEQSRSEWNHRLIVQLIKIAQM